MLTIDYISRRLHIDSLQQFHILSRSIKTQNLVLLLPQNFSSHRVDIIDGKELKMYECCVTWVAWYSNQISWTSIRWFRCYQGTDMKMDEDIFIDGHDGATSLSVLIRRLNTVHRKRNGQWTYI
jgi:hypothetical protein